MGCIYKITCIPTGKSYIGKTVDKKRRIYDHLNGNAKSCIALHNAINKYGKENFTVTILHDNVFNELLADLEIEAIKAHNSRRPNGYNLTDGGEGAQGRIYTAEARERMSKAMTKEVREKISKANTGKIRSPEARLKVSKANKGRKHTDATRQRMSKANKGRIPANKSSLWNDKESIAEIIRLYTEEFKSFEDIAKIFNVSKNTVDRIIKANGIDLKSFAKDKSKETRRRMSEAAKGRNSSDIWQHQEEVVRLYTKEFKTTKEIANVFNVSYPTVSKVLKSNGIQLRKRGTRKSNQL